MQHKPLRDLEVGIVGASIAGLAAAHGLASRGARVHLFERSLHLAERGGSGIMLDTEVAGAIGGLATRTHVVRRILGGQLQTLWTRPVRKLATSWGELYRCLRARVAEDLVQSGCLVRGCTLDGRLFFEDSGERRFDLVIGADGLGSTVRESFQPGFQPAYCGYVAIRGMCKSERWPASGELLNVYGRGCHAVLYHPAGTLLNWMCYCNVPDPAGLMVDERGLSHRWSLPPDAVSPQLKRRLVEMVRERMPSEMVRLVEETPGIYVQSIYHGIPDHFAGGRIALVGDAAHVSPPHLGAATSTACEDVDSLCQALCRGEGLEDWGRRRREEVRATVETAHELGQQLQFGDHDWNHWTEANFESWWSTVTGGLPLYFDVAAGDS